MSEEVYEIDANYREAAAYLVKLIEERDELAEALPQLRADKMLEARDVLRAMDAEIEKLEAALAKENYWYQKMRREQKLFEQEWAQTLESAVKAYVHAKHNHPDIAEDVKEKALACFGLEREQEFYDRVAIYEADETEFENIIAREEKHG